MLGFLLRLVLVVAVVAAFAVLFEFRWTGAELRIRPRFSSMRTQPNERGLPVQGQMRPRGRDADIPGEAHTGEDRARLDEIIRTEGRQ